MLELDIENYMQQHNQNMDMNNRAIEDVKYQWEFQLKDLETRHQYELTDFDEMTQYNLNLKKEDLENWQTFEYQRQLDEIEQNRLREIEQTRTWYTNELQSIDREYQNRTREINNRWDDYLVYLDGYWNEIIQENIRDGDQEAIDYHNKRKARDQQDTETTRQRELEDAFNENQRSIWDLEDEKTFQDADTENRFARDKENTTKALANEKAIREQEIATSISNTERERSSLLERHKFEVEDYNLRAESSLQDVEMNIEFGNQQMAMELERREMQWDLRRQQIQVDYENQLMDYQNQKEQVKFQAELEKQRLSMDQAKLEAEMMQMQTDLTARQSETDRFYDESLMNLENESSTRLEELERRKSEQNLSEEEYQEMLSDYDRWYLERQYEIDSEYDQRLRELEFDQRQYQNMQTVIDNNELYQEGERGFFGNPIAGTVRQGGVTDNLSDPGTLAMIGIVVTVGTTFLQLFRGK